MPAAQTLNLNGIVTVPLFSAPYTLPAGFNANGFRRYSWWPQVSGGFANNSIPQNVGIISASNMAIPGPANVLATQTFGAQGSTAAPIFLGSSLDGLGAISSPSENIFYSSPLNVAGGLNQNNIINSAKFVQWPVLTAQGLGTVVAWDYSATLSQAYPFWDPTQGPLGGPMMGTAIVITAFGSAITGQYLQRPSLTYQQLDMFDLGISWNSLAAHVIYYQCPAQSGLIYGLFDTNGAAPPYTIPRQICAYRPGNFTGAPPFPLQNYTPVFDNATLQSVWTGGPFSGYTLDIWKGGWIIKLGTGGAGPTGQPEEIAITDPGMTTYNLLRFVPQDAGAQTVFNHATTFGWQVKVDPNGVLYFNSGAPADQLKILYSYSTIAFLYPQFVYKPGVILLPCYTPCDAVTVPPEG